MKLITKFLCAIGRHEYGGGHWYEGRLLTNEHWLYVKQCIHCNQRKITNTFHETKPS